jgi:hypothetical protein
MSTLPIQINPNNIHQGPGNLWFNVPVPATGSRLLIGANGAPTTGAVWEASTTYLAGTQIVDTNGNLQRAVNSGETGNTNAAENLTITTTASSGALTGGIIDVPGTGYVAGQLVSVAGGTGGLFTVVTAAGGIPSVIALVAGGSGYTSTTGAATTALPTPVWGTSIGDITADGTVNWLCVALGALYYAGAIEGATTQVFAPKIEEIMADQVAGPIDNVITAATASIEVEMKETDMLHVANWFSGGIYGAGTDAGLPTGAQEYQQLSFGGLIVVPKLSMAVISPRRNNSGKFVVSQLYMCSQAEQMSFAVTRTKESMVKVKFSGLFDPTRPQGDQAGMIWWGV